MKYIKASSVWPVNRGKVWWSTPELNPDGEILLQAYEITLNFCGHDTTFDRVKTLKDNLEIMDDIKADVVKNNPGLLANPEHSGPTFDWTGGEKTYRTLLKLEKCINELEKDFKRDERDMDDDRASNVKKSIGNIKQSWTAIWADFNER